jgi:multidrug efflux pump subunit AcrA (membrane-fusion protein)
MKRKLRPKLLVLILGLIVLVIGAGSTAMLKKPKPIAPEKIVLAERGDIARSVVARGKIEPLSKVAVNPRPMASSRPSW